MEITSEMIIKADGTTGQSIKKGTGVKTPHIQDGAVATAKIDNEAVTEIKIANGAVTSEKLANYSVTYEKLDSNTVGKLVTHGNNHDNSFLKWLVGSGVPKGNDGFRIVPLAGSNNNFTIKGGTTEKPGYCLVEGWDAMIEQKINNLTPFGLPNPSPNLKLQQLVPGKKIYSWRLQLTAGASVTHCRSSCVVETCDFLYYNIIMEQKRIVRSR